jgi:hypothetical protein
MQLHRFTQRAMIDHNGQGCDPAQAIHRSEDYFAAFGSFSSTPPSLCQPPGEIDGLRT